MPEYFYKDALKQGLKEQKAAAAKDLPTGLAVLEDLITPEQALCQVDLGLIQVPAAFIVGTRDHGRETCFSPGFMPVLAEGTEFATKWEALCQSHLDQGIRDPIKAVEYKNRYYVIEGNKRVSVLKFFGTTTIPATVSRIPPIQDGSPETELYNEFTAFFRHSGINYVEFTKKGSYAQLQKLVGKAPEEDWTEDERRRFSRAYQTFLEVYTAMGGNKLSTTVGDALLPFLEVYGYAMLTSSGTHELKHTVGKMWEEVKLREKGSPIELKLDPDAEKKQSLLAKVLPTGQNTGLRVAFLHDKTPELSGWTRAHEAGRFWAEESLGGKVSTTSYENVLRTDPQQVLEQAIADGNTVLFTTSPRLLKASLRAAIDHPEITVMNCSLNISHRYIRSYYARMYEVKFIIGAIAGSLSQSGKLGYIADYPIFGQIAGVNAFALGARMVNPRAKVYLEWSSLKGTPDCVKNLLSQQIHLISSQDVSRLRDADHASFGLERHTDDGGKTLLAVPEWRWGKYYEQILRRILNKTEKSAYETSDSALNYYWGLSAGVVDLHMDASIPESTRQLAEFFKTSIAEDRLKPFCAPLRKQGGEQLRFDGALSQEEIINMDFLVENVVGSIPVYEDLSPLAQATVNAVGVQSASKKTPGSAL